MLNSKKLILIFFRVLIHSGVSPVGCIACQLAKFYDWEVTVTCTDRAQSIARALKADKIVVYGNIKMENELSQDRQVHMKKEKFQNCFIL